MMSFSTRIDEVSNIAKSWVIPNLRSVEYEVVKIGIRAGVNSELLSSVLIYAT